MGNANRVTFLMAILLLILSNPIVADQNLEKRYQLALENARSGNLNTSLKELEKLVRSSPETKRFRYDYILVLSWANRYDDVLKQSHLIDLANAPDYVLEEVARAARHTKQFEKSEKIYRMILLRSPGRISAQVGLALVLIDQARIKQALKILHELQKQHPDNISILAALAYAYNTDKF